MIVICEPICREFSHEKVNSGFIYGLRLAFPDETLRFYADSTHISSIKEILAHDNIVIENIEYIPIKFIDSSSLSGAVNYYRLFKKMFTELKKLNINKVFFLSYSPLILYLIKKLKQFSNFRDFKFTFVLHGDFENINTTIDPPEDTKLPISHFNTPKLAQKLGKLKLVDYIPKIWSVGKILVKIGINKVKINPSKWLSTKNMLLLNSSADFRYIALSPHIVSNAAKYIDVEKLNIHIVMFPTKFVKAVPAIANKYVKFAVFGYGDPLMLINIAHKISQKKPSQPYEIRIIGMNNRGMADYSNITCPSAGKPLTRQDMEKYAEDIDVFLILYNKNKYRLSCSGSIIESLSYTKPIIHFNNECINTFNTNKNPIGMRCNTIDDFADKMVDIIENYNKYITELNIYRNNILKLREELAIENSSLIIRDSFSW
jgi:hypothetical protein